MVEYNIETGMPTISEALYILERACDAEKGAGCRVLVVIHGYGSSGKGGAIRVAARQWLNAQVKKGYFKAVVNGENFGMFDSEARRIKEIDSGSIKYYGNQNPGITVVLLQ